MDPVGHLAAGIIIAQGLASPGESLVPLACAAVASQLPDLDFVTKKLGTSTLFLRMHHRLGHSAFVLVPVGLLIAGVASLGTGYADFWRLAAIVLLTLASHVVLDILIHSPGVSFFWPLSHERVSLSLIMGPNPMTSSAQCGQRRITVCLKCQARGTLYVAMAYLLVAGAALSLAATPLDLARPVSAGVGTLIGLYVGFCSWQRARATATWTAALRGQELLRVMVVPGGYSPWRWFGLAEAADGFHTAYIDTRRAAIEDRRHHVNSLEHDLVERSRDTETVRTFLREAIFPHVSTRRGDGFTEVKWRDLSYAFSPDTDLYTAKVQVSRSGDVLSHEFRERWA